MAKFKNFLKSVVGFVVPPVGMYFQAKEAKKEQKRQNEFVAQEQARINRQKEEADAEQQRQAKRQEEIARSRRQARRRSSLFFERENDMGLRTTLG